MNISISTDVRVKFTPEERTALELSRDTLKEVGKKLWQSNNDDVMDMGFFFDDVSNDINDILNGNY